MNLDDYKNELSELEMAQPQRQAKAIAAVDGLKAAIGELQALGYRLAVVEEFGLHEAPKTQEYPKMLYRGGVPPTLIVNDEMEEAKARKDGWAGLNEEAKVESPKPQAPSPAPKPTPVPAPNSNPPAS